MTTFIFDGHHDEEVISSQQSADINTGLYGAGSYVLPVGSQFEPTIVSNNEVTIQDGICSIQGHRGGLDYGQSQSFTIENGTSGMMRSDLLIIRYTKDETTLVESFSFHTIKGTAAVSDPEDPAITEADIQGGALVTEAALYRVHINGTNLVAVERIWGYPESMPVSEEGAWSLAPLIAPFELTLPAGFDEDSFFRYGIFDGTKRYCAYLNPTSAVTADTALGTLDSAYRPSAAIILRTNLAGVTVTISTAGVVKLVTTSVPAGLVCKSEIIGKNSLGGGLTYKDIDRLISQNGAVIKTNDAWPEFESDGSRYRKFADGRAEIDIHVSGTKDCTVPTDGGWYTQSANTIRALPIVLTSIDMLTHTLFPANGGCMLFIFTTGFPTEIRYRLQHSANKAGMNFTAHFRVLGRWK